MCPVPTEPVPCPVLRPPRRLPPPPPALTAPWTLTFLRGGQRGPAPGLALRAGAPGAWWTGPFSLAAVPDGAPQDPAVAHRGGAEAAGAQPGRRRALHEGEWYAPGRGGGAGTASGPRFPACGVLPQHRDWEHPEHVVCLPRLLGVVPSSPSVRAGTGGRLRFSEVRVAASVRCPGEALRPGALANTPPARALPGPHRCRVSPAAMLDEDEDERVDEAALRQLTEMGFPEGRAAKALRLNQYVGPSPPGRGAWSPGAPRR